jgi:hypothetical protein
MSNGTSKGNEKMLVAKKKVLEKSVAGFVKWYCRALKGFTAQQFGRRQISTLSLKSILC